MHKAKVKKVVNLAIGENKNHEMDHTNPSYCWDAIQMTENKKVQKRNSSLTCNNFGKGCRGSQQCHCHKRLAEYGKLNKRVGMGRWLKIKSRSPSADFTHKGKAFLLPSKRRLFFDSLATRLPEVLTCLGDC
jgi:hypothetical protein